MPIPAPEPALCGRAGRETHGELNDRSALACGGPTDRIARWAELLSTAAACRQATGCITDGLVDDVKRIREMRFPVFHRGIGPLDLKGRGEMKERHTTVVCAGVTITSGDYVLGDYVLGDCDGVLIILKAIAEEAPRNALENVQVDDRTRQEPLAGRTLMDVYDTYGVL